MKCFDFTVRVFLFSPIPALELDSPLEAPGPPSAEGPYIKAIIAITSLRNSD
jgi:hypothetical protein